jgi:5-formyltetrahydrofolate cyclo-ligase
MTLTQLYKPVKKMRVAGFMSGSGSNLLRILQLQEKTSNLFDVVMIFSDNKNSNAQKIAREYSVPYYCTDITEFYGKKGIDRKDMAVRKEFDAETAALLRKHSVDVVALCGYMSLVTSEIYDSYLTVNVHPGDLRVMSGGKRLYTGSHAVRKALQVGAKEVRATTHIVSGEVDGGPILMVSDAVMVPGGISEPDIDSAAGELQEKLKNSGDWKIYPETIKRLAEGRFWIDKEEHFVLDVSAEKAALRSGMKKLRERLGADDVARASEAITQKLLAQDAYINAKTILFYMATQKEVQTRAAIENAIAAGKQVVLPVSNTATQELELSALKSLGALSVGPLGIKEPAEKEQVAYAAIDLVVVPGIAFDEHGNRTGHGLGYYDKLLKKIPCKKIALAHEVQVVDKVVVTEDDVPVNAIITEKRVIDCGNQ